jgi:hypothetical protein
MSNEINILESIIVYYYSFEFVHQLYQFELRFNISGKVYINRM